MDGNESDCNHDFSRDDGNCVKCGENILPFADHVEMPERIVQLEAELAAKDAQLGEWLKENGPGGWIDDLRKEVAAKDAVIARLVETLKSVRVDVGYKRNHCQTATGRKNAAQTLDQIHAALALAAPKEGK